jgi:transcriptional regulator with XRE-family HTH domain
MNWFEETRKRNKLTLKQQAADCGVSQTSIVQYEKMIAMPRMTDNGFSQVASGYRVTSEELESVILKYSRQIRSGKTKRNK